jgi:hypothetical protein
MDKIEILSTECFYVCRHDYHLPIETTIKLNKCENNDCVCDYLINNGICSLDNQECYYEIYDRRG